MDVTKGLKQTSISSVGITETWLSSEEVDNVTTLSTLIPSTYKMSHVPRQGSTGGGAAFICKDHNKVRVDSSCTASSFESITVMLDAVSYTLRFVGLYHIPPSNNNKLKKSLFVEQLSNYLEIATTLPGRLVLVGDFSVHWDCEDDSERVELATLLEDFDLVQHVKGPTHECGHTLNLVITRKEGDLV